MLNKIIPATWGLLLFVFASATTFGAGTVEKSDYDSYIVIMRLDPAIAYEGTVPGYEATKPGKGKKINPKSEKVKKYKGKLQKDHDELLAAYGLQGNKVHDYSIAVNGFSARMTYEQAKGLALNKRVSKVIPDRLYQKTTDNTPTFLGLNGKKGPWDRGFDGEGVVVGVIDTGIWPEHPSFADDGSYAAPPIVLDDSVFPNCDFGNIAHNMDDAAFTCNNKLIGSRQMLQTYRAVLGALPDEFDSSRDDDGHGTHTSSTAAGNEGVAASILGVDRGVVSGIAPRAHVIMYKGLGFQGGFGSDLTRAIDQAVADGVDVINYSVGSSSPSIGSDDLAFLFAADAGVWVATSNGNSGPGAATTGSPASVPWLTSVGASTHDRTFQGSASSDDGGWEFFGASITAGTDVLPLIDAADAGSELCIPDELDPMAVDGKIVLCLRGDIARVEKSRAVSIAGGAGMILYNTFDGDSEVTDTHYVPSVHINNTDGLVIKDYIGTTVDPEANINGGEYTAQDAPSMAAFSSRGPNRLSSDIIKPDITAPGVNVLAGASPLPVQPAPVGELFQSISGTSMSSPHVAGIFALLKQAHPDWSPAMARSALMTTAHQDVVKEDGATPADAFDMGAGHVVPGGDVKKKGSLFKPGLVYDAGFLEYLGFLCGADTGLVGAGTCAGLADAGIPIDPSDLNLPSIGIGELAGSQTVVRTVRKLDKSSKKYYVNVDAPPGYEVTVTPDQMKLKGGESGTYAVTIRNVSATAGEWVHGSLAWDTKKPKSNKKSKKSGKSGKSGKKSTLIYSPIAVRGVPLGAPGEVSGAGVDGEASFDVAFGYTGAYMAAAHGLEPATVDSGVVVQDPDQAFDPADGFSNPHGIVVSGAALLSIRMPPEATPDLNTDIDLYLEDPGGSIVALSGNGGTDEAIEIQAPVDGMWTLWVHGWSVPEGSQPYDAYNWVISATPGGNLSVDAAPASATTGDTEAVDISWTGAAAGQWHKGAVSHNGPDGLLGLTRVDVDNR